MSTWLDNRFLKITHTLHRLCLNEIIPHFIMVIFITLTMFDIGGTAVKINVLARDLGVKLDFNLTPSHHVSAVCKAAFLCIKQNL